MNYFSTNLKFLRREKGVTQEGLAEVLCIKRPVIGSYEEKRAEPSMELMNKMSDFFNVSVDELFNRDLTAPVKKNAKPEEALLKVLTIVTDRDNKELVTAVPVKAAAGYLTGFADAEFVESLPRFSLPLPELKQDRTYRAFQIKGESMLPVKPGSYIIAEYVESPNFIKNKQTYIVVTLNDGIVFKRIAKEQNGQLKLISDNVEFEPYVISTSDVVELWKAAAVISFSLD